MHLAEAKLGPLFPLFPHFPHSAERNPARMRLAVDETGIRTLIWENIFAGINCECDAVTVARKCPCAHSICRLQARICECFAGNVKMRPTYFWVDEGSALTHIRSGHYTCAPLSILRWHHKFIANNRFYNNNLCWCVIFVVSCCASDA